MRAFVLAWVLATCAEPGGPAMRARVPLGVHVPEPRSDVLGGTIPPAWEEGLTWMLKERCGFHSLSNEWVPSTDFPSYSFMKVVRATASEFELEQQDTSSTRTPREGKTRIVIQRSPFRVLKVTVESINTTYVRGAELVDDFDDATVTFPDFHAPSWLGRGWTHLLGVPGPETGNEHTPKDWFIQERLFRTEQGVMFQFWRFHKGTEGPVTLTWRRSDPYWEDSLGCTRLVRSRTGAAYRPSDPTDFGPEEPAVVDVPDLDYPQQPKVPMYVTPPDDPPFPPRWEVGMQWITRTWCTGPKKVLDPPTILWGPRPPAVPDRPVYAQYRVLRATDEEFVLAETKTQKRKGDATDSGKPTRWDVHHRIRRQPFGVWQWWRRPWLHHNGDSWSSPLAPSSDEKAFEYNGGPCLNLGGWIDHCPFAMPALSREPAEEASWVAQQTMQEHPWGVEFSYLKADGSTVRMTWRRGEPWPEASPSCTVLLRDESGAVYVPQGHEDNDWDYKRTAAYAEDLALESERLRAK